MTRNPFTDMAFGDILMAPGSGESDPITTINSEYNRRTSLNTTQKKGLESFLELTLLLVPFCGAMIRAEIDSPNRLRLPRRVSEAFQFHSNADRPNAQRALMQLESLIPHLPATVSADVQSTLLRNPLTLPFGVKVSIISDKFEGLDPSDWKYELDGIPFDADYGFPATAIQEFSSATRLFIIYLYCLDVQCVMMDWGKGSKAPRFFPFYPSKLINDWITKTMQRHLRFLYKLHSIHGAELKNWSKENYLTAMEELTVSSATPTPATSI